MFRSQLLRRLTVSYVIVILIVTLIVGVLISRQLSEKGWDDIRQSLMARTQLLADIAKPVLLLKPEDQALSQFQETLVQLGRNTNSRFTVINVTGEVIADSRESPVKMDNHAQRPEIIQARKTGSGVSSRFSHTLQRKMLYRANQVLNGKELIGFVRTSLPLSAIDERLVRLRLVLLLSALIAAIAALLLGYFFAKNLSTPLIEMTEIAEAISRGDFDKRINVNYSGELGQLANAFNRMARNSARRMDEITDERNRLAKLFTGMVEGVIGVDPEQKIIHINKAAEGILGLSVQDSINKPIWNVVRVPEIINSMELAVDSGDVVKTQLRVSTESADLVVQIYAAPLVNDNRESIGAVIVLHDISDVDRLQRVRRDFVANASHELKTPITAIRGLIESILDDPDMEMKTQQRFIRKVHVQSLRLSSLVSDLMTISRLESDQRMTNKDQFDLTELIRRSALAYRSVCNEKQLFLETVLPEVSMVMVGDIQLIGQVIDNLLDNAIKYTPASGTVSIALTKTKQFAELRVRDTGIGISAQYHQRVFERFYRIDKARSRELGGTGLGLSIVKNIVEQHGGRISLASQAGHGACFSIELPLEASSSH